jgi:hypothetical protein
LGYRVDLLINRDATNPRVFKDDLRTVLVSQIVGLRWPALSVQNQFAQIVLSQLAVNPAARLNDLIGNIGFHGDTLTRSPRALIQRPGAWRPSSAPTPPLVGSAEPGALLGSLRVVTVLGAFSGL